MPFTRNSMPSLVLAFMASVFAASPGFAQSNSEQDTGNQTVEGDLAMGEEVDNTPQPGDTYVRETFDDWSLRCIVVADGEDPCQMYQLLADEGGAPIAEFTMFRLPEGSQAAAGATIIVPLETSLQQQLSIQVDTQPARRYPFAFCNTVGCYARIGLTPEDVESYKRGANAVLSIVPIAAPDQTVNVTMSLSGFTAALDVVSVINRQ